MMQFLYYVAQELCHEYMTGKRGGGECHRGEYEYCRNGYIPISYGSFIFLWENTFITPLLMASLHCIIDDIIVMSETLLKTINKHVIDSEVHNTARFQ